MKKFTISADNFVQPSISCFDAYYDYWSMLMASFLKSKEYWHIVEFRVATPAVGEALAKVQQKKLEALKLKDLKTKNY